MTSTKPLSEILMDAALRIDELSSEEISKLLIKAAIRLRVIQQSGAKLEHIPVYAYHLLRRISQGAVPADSLFGQEDEAAVAFLISREMIRRSDDGRLTITEAGEELGEIADERSPDHP